MSRQILQRRSASVAALIWMALFVLLLTKVDPGATPVASTGTTVEQFIAEAEDQPAAEAYGTFEDLDTTNLGDWITTAAGP